MQDEVRKGLRVLTTRSVAVAAKCDMANRCGRATVMTRIMGAHPERPHPLKINADTLAVQLNRTLPHIVLVTGDDPLLSGEACDAIRAKARATGFTERELHFVERGFDWAALRDQSRNLSLFADRKIVEIRLGSASPGEPGTAAIIELAEQ